MTRRLALATTAGLALFAPAASPASESPHVVARDVTQRAVADLRLSASGRFALAYRHSRERAPAEERYLAGPGGDGFRLTAVASPDAGVLDYYELEGRRARVDGWWVLTLARPVSFATGMDLAASAHGRRTLVVGGRRLALHPRRGATHVHVDVEGS